MNPPEEKEIMNQIFTKLLKAIKNNQLATWPGLTTEVVQKYLPD